MNCDSCRRITKHRIYSNMKQDFNSSEKWVSPCNHGLVNKEITKHINSGPEM